MPLTETGEKIMKAMKAEYGDEEGERVFYASKAKGTITGVDSQPQENVRKDDSLLSRLDTMSEQISSLGKGAAKIAERMDGIGGIGSSTWRKEISRPGVKSYEIAAANAKEYKRFRDAIDKASNYGAGDPAKVAKLQAELAQVKAEGEAAHQAAPIKMTYVFGGQR